MGFFEKDYSGLKYYKPGQLDALQSLVTKQKPEKFWQDSSWNVSDPSFRQLALMYYQQEEYNSKSRKKRLQLDKKMVIRGDLTVDTNLVVRSNGSLVVLGNLTVSGNVFVASDYPSLYVSGELRAENLYASEAEIIVLQDIHISNIFALKYNHTVVIAPKTHTSVSAIEDAFPDTKIKSDRKFSQLGAKFYTAMIDPGFKDTHQSEDEYFEMREEIDDGIWEFFGA